MGTKAYFMVNLDKEYGQDARYLETVRDLQSMPEVESVETVSGVCDLLVKIDAPLRVISVANKISGRKWVKDIHVLKIEYGEAAGLEPSEPKPVKIQATLPK